MKLISLKKQTSAVTEIVGVILMIVIVIISVTTFHFYMGESTASKLDKNPMIVMVQKDRNLFVSSIQYGPVKGDSVIIKVKARDGKIVCDGIISTPSGENIGIADKIDIPCAVSGESYTVMITYEDLIIGETKYIYR